MPVSRARSARLSNWAERSAAARRKRLEVAQARDLQELPQVPLQVGRHVGPEEALRVDVPVLVQLRKAAPHQELLGAQIRMRRLRLGERQRLELEDRGAARQRVGDRFHQAERLRAGEEEGAVAPALAIDRRLQVPEQAGRILHLVQDDGRRVPREKGVRVALGLLRLARQVERHESVIREEPPHQAGLPGLAGAGQHDDRPRRGPLQQKRLDATVDPHRANYRIQSNNSCDVSQDVGSGR